jgi:hypothetical protein
MMMRAVAPRALAMRRNGDGASGVMLTVRRQVMMTLMLTLGFAATGTVRAAATPLRGFIIGGGLMIRGGGRSLGASGVRSQLGAGMMTIPMIAIKNFTVRRGRPHWPFTLARHAGTRVVMTMMMQAVAPRTLAMRRGGGGASGVMLTVRRQVMMTLVLRFGFAATGKLGAGMMMIPMITIKNFTVRRGRPNRPCLPAAISGPFAMDAAAHQRLRLWLGGSTTLAWLLTVTIDRHGTARPAVPRAVDTEPAKARTTPEPSLQIACGTGSQALRPLDGYTSAPVLIQKRLLSAIVDMPSCGRHCPGRWRADVQSRMGVGTRLRLTACLNQPALAVTVRPEMTGSDM